MISGMISGMISYVISDTIWCFFYNVWAMFYLSAQRGQIFEPSPNKNKNQFFIKMPLTFLGFEHLPAGANQAIYAIQPLVLYI